VDVPRAPLPIKEFDELALLIRAHHPLICINAQEPERVEVLLEYLCGCFGLPYFEWTPSSGLRREGQPGAVYGTQGLLAALAHVHASKLVAIYHFNLSGESLDDGRAISKLLELAEELGKHPGAIVISFVETLPPAASLERAAYGLNMVGFILWTFVIWVVYAAYMHARATAGWEPRKATWIALAGYVCVLLNFTVVNLLFTGLHSYSGLK